MIDHDMFFRLIIYIYVIIFNYILSTANLRFIDDFPSYNHPCSAWLMFSDEGEKSAAPRPAMHFPNRAGSDQGRMD